MKCSGAQRWKLSRSRCLALILACQCLALGWTISTSSPGVDEWGHLAAGMAHWSHGQFDQYIVNPPLVRLVAAFPVLFCDYPSQCVFGDGHPQTRPEWDNAEAMVRQVGWKAVSYVRLARCAVMWFAVLGTVLIYRLAQVVLDNSAKLFAAIFWAFSPSVLANGSMITPDIPAAVMVIAMALALFHWCEHPSHRRMLILGVVAGLGLSTKTTFVIFFGCSLLWMLLRRNGSPSFLSRLIAAAGVTVVAVTVLNGCYAFSGVGTRLGELRFTSVRLAGGASPGNVFAETTMGMLPIPLPRDYLEGIDLQRSEFEKLKPSYLFGKWQPQGTWYYYLVAVIIKEPLSLILIATIGIGMMVRNHRRISPNFMFLVSSGACLFTLVSLQTGINRHLRYVFLSYPALFLLCSFALSNVSCRAVRCCFLWAYLFAACIALPYPYAYFSELIGGSSRGARYIGGSCLDWGQGLAIVERWMQRRKDSVPIYLLWNVNVVNVEHLLACRDGRRYLSSFNAEGVPTAAGWWIVFPAASIEPWGKWSLDLSADELLPGNIRVLRVDTVKTDYSQAVGTFPSRD